MKQIFLDFFLLLCLVLSGSFLFAQLAVAGTSTSTSGTTVSGNYPSGGCTVCDGDGSSPAAVSDLTVTAVTANSVSLRWTAPGDDGNFGTAASYDLRYSTSEINDGNWAAVTPASGEPAPSLAGTTQTMSVTNLSANTTYFFALKTSDEVPNTSNLSNVASSSTLPTVIPDTTPPIISNIQFSVLSPSSVRIIWSTNENANSVIVYSLDTSYNLGPVSSPTLTTSHSLDLTGLTSATTYHFKVKSTDASNNEAVSADQTFNIGDVTPPAISNIQKTNITGISARITWLTNEAANSTVIYGLTTDYEAAPVTDNSLLTSHVIDLTGLQPETEYHFKVKSADASNNEAVSSDQVFTTGDITAPVISNVQVVTQVISATINWETNEVADSQVAYGKTTNLGSLSSSANKVTNHSLTLGGLQSATKYYFVVRSTDENGNQGSSEMGEFTTNADVTPPANVSSLQAVAGDKKNTLSWQNPSDNDLAGIMIRRSTTGFPSGPAEGMLVFQGSGTSKEDTGLTNGVLYYYSVFAYDTSNNFSSGAIISGTPSAGGQPHTEEPPIPGIGGPSEINFQLSDFSFTAANGKINIPPSLQMNFLPGSDFGVSISSLRIPKPVESIILNVNNNFYLLRFDIEKNLWSAEVTVPAAPNKYQSDILFTFQDKQTSTVSWQTSILPLGRIYEKKNGVEVPVAGATVSLLTSPTLWPAEAYGQQNPQTTNVNGEFGYLVPPGKYILRVEKTGYQTQETGYFDSKGIVVNNAIEFLAVPPKLEEVINPEAPLVENVANVAKNLGQKTVFASKVVQKEIVATAKNVTKEVEQFVANPIVKETTSNVVAPVVAGAAAVSATTAVGASQLLMYLRFLFTQPVLVLFRRKRKGWGVVYNSLTKMPLDLITVRLVDTVTGRVVQSKVTDKEGRYAFLPLPGKYIIDIKQTNFKFPTDFLGALKEDKNFLDLYHGEVIEVKERGAILTPNIPLDPVGEDKPIGKILWQLALRRLQHAFSIVSLILAVVFILISPGFLTGILLATQVVFYILFLRLAFPRKPKSWGIVYNTRNKKPLDRTVVRIFDTQYNKLLETQVTDHKGRYAFLVGRNKYYMMYEKPGFEKKQSEPVDLQNHPEPTASIGVDVGLHPENQQKPAAPTVAAPPQV